MTSSGSPPREPRWRVEAAFRGVTMRMETARDRDDGSRWHVRRRTQGVASNQRRSTNSRSRMLVGDGWSGRQRLAASIDRTAPAVRMARVGAKASGATWHTHARAFVWLFSVECGAEGGTCVARASVECAVRCLMCASLVPFVCAACASRADEPGTPARSDHDLIAISSRSRHNLITIPSSACALWQ